MMTEDKRTKEEKAVSEHEETKKTLTPDDCVSETWAQETIEDLDDFIESQGIYLRQ